ncbi:MAG TPA: FixG Ig-like domain-containing protein, partial [Thiohalobacter sp.]|nr:FixG Ig-like domain-containing protein [Thiohalobacter sp.]
LGGLVYAIATRVPVDLNIIRDRNALYRETPMGLVENIYTLKLINMDERAHAYRLSVEGLEQAELIFDRDTLEVPAGAVAELLVQVRIDPVYLERPSNEIFFVLEAQDNPDIRIRQSGRFLGPS